MYLWSPGAATGVFWLCCVEKRFGFNNKHDQKCTSRVSPKFCFNCKSKDSRASLTESNVTVLTDTINSGQVSTTIIINQIPNKIPCNTVNVVIINVFIFFCKDWNMTATLTHNCCNHDLILDNCYLQQRKWATQFHLTNTSHFFCKGC